jgi:hypothetical protein
VRVPVLVLLLLTGCTSTGSASLGPATLDERDTRSLTVTALHGACDSLQPVEVEEDDREVRVEVPLTVEPGGCDDLGVVDEVPVLLDEPLGDRRVVAAGTGRSMTVLGRDRCRPFREPLPQYLGLTEAQARERARQDGYVRVRVVCVDGRTLDHTSDGGGGRVDLALDDGVVSSARG